MERTRGNGTDRDRLLRAAREGDGIALARLLELSEGDLRTAATRAVGRRGHPDLHGEDVFAESMVTVVREIATLRSNDYQGFRHWFSSIARNQVRRTLRRSRGRTEALLGSEPDERASATPGQGARMRRALALLPRSQAVAYVLREGLGLSWRAIGFVLGRPSAAARLVHYRAAQRMGMAVCRKGR